MTLYHITYTARAPGMQWDDIEAPTWREAVMALGYRNRREDLGDIIVHTVDHRLRDGAVVADYRNPVIFPIDEDPRAPYDSANHDDI